MYIEFKWVWIMEKTVSTILWNCIFKLEKKLKQIIANDDTDKIDYAVAMTPCRA